LEIRNGQNDVCFTLHLCRPRHGGCGSKLNGTYHQTAGVGITLEFKSGKVYSSVLGQTAEGTYELKDGHVTLHLKGEGDVTLKLDTDGTLDSPLGMFAKKGS
jgi:hypothetical protein